MAGEVRLIVRVTVLGADVGLAREHVLTTGTDTETVEVVAAAEPADAAVGVTALEVQIGLGRKAEVDAPAGIQIPTGLDATLLGGRVARLNVHAERHGVANREVETRAGAKKEAVGVLPVGAGMVPAGERFDAEARRSGCIRTLRHRRHGKTQRGGPRREHSYTIHWSSLFSTNAELLTRVSARCGS